MKDFEDMTDQEKEEIREQVQNLPEDSRNSSDSNTCCLCYLLAPLHKKYTPQMNYI